MEDLEENEFNLNIPRYVDTFEPEAEIVLSNAIEEFRATIRRELDMDNLLNNFSFLWSQVAKAPTITVSIMIVHL